MHAPRLTLHEDQADEHPVDQRSPHPSTTFDLGDAYKQELVLVDHGTSKERKRGQKRD